MASADRDQRATETATKAVELLKQGKSEEAARALREAISLAPENDKVKAAFAQIQTDEALQPLLKLCREFAQEKNNASGKDALWYLSSGSGTSVPPKVAEQAFQYVFDDQKADRNIRDDLVASLIQHCLGARAYVATLLESAPSPTFEKLFEIGDGAANGITGVSLDPAAWKDETSRRSREKDVFLLFLAKLLESGHDNDGRALKGIARHLAIDAEKLHTVIDEESFDAIMACLDYRLPQEVRGQATLATAKYLEASRKVGEGYLERFITSRTAKHGSEDLVLAFSCAAATFPIATTLLSSLFLIEGFLPSLIPLLDKKSRPIKVEKAALDMLSAACIDGGCREAIVKYCWDWMHHVMEDEEDERHGQAALILAKAQSQPAVQDPPTKNTSHGRTPSKSITDVVPALKNMLYGGTDVDKRTGVEGLAYASMQPPIKDEIVRDTALLEKLTESPKKDSIGPTTAFGILTLIDNLTRYLPELTEEQQKITELKAYANDSKPRGQPHTLDEEPAVTNRCKRLLDAGVVSFIVTLKSSAVSYPLSTQSLAIISRIFLSLAKAPSARGALAQQGAIPLLLQICSLGIVDVVKHTAVHALARVLISVDPSLIQSYTSSCIPPLLTLLDPSKLTSEDSNAPRDLLPTFEALLAITNLCSDPSWPTGPIVVRQAFSTLEDLLLHSNTGLQRAATELLCNLAAGPAGLEKVADGSPAAAKRLNILLALADAEDLRTRQAAGGALACASEFEAAVKQILAREGGLERVFSICRDEDPGCRHRGSVVLRNMICAEGDAGVQARKLVKAKGGAEVLGDMLTTTGGLPQVVELAAEAARALSK